MGRLDHTITALDVLGSVVQAVPVVGDGLKSATEVATKICEVVKKMKENREAYEDLADRAVRLLAAVANSISKASLDKLKGMEGNVARLLFTLQEIKLAAETRLHAPASTRKRDTLKKFIRSKGKDVLRVSEDQEETKKLGAQLDRAVEELNVTSSMRLELGVEDVRALSMVLLKRIVEMNHEMSRAAMNATLADLHPIHSARWDEVGVNPCMESTREKLLSDIMAWAEAPAAPVVFWLNGLAGTGKSTIARTICEDLAKTGLLGASFFLSRQVAERRHAPNAVRTIVYQLARQHRAFADALSATLHDSPDLASSEVLQRLATELLFKPAGVLAEGIGLVFVIDALDECTHDNLGRPGGELLPLLLRGLLQLSGRVKLLLTSRNEPAIVRMFEDASWGMQRAVVQLHDLDRAVVRADIRKYLLRSFADIVKNHPEMNLVDWPSQEDLNTVADVADTLFVFATTVVRFVGAPKRNPRARLDIMLARREGSSASPYRFLDRLYLQVLRTSVFSEEQEEEVVLCESLRVVVGSIVAAQQPLSVAVHALLLDQDPADVQLVVRNLSALLISTSDEPVRIFHPSFPDFMVDSRRCDESRFQVVPDEDHLRLAHGCLALLNRHLRYNIANLDDPDIANVDVEDLDGRLLRGICHGRDNIGLSLSQGLFYAARHWAAHVVSIAAVDSRLVDTLTFFCHNHLLHWLELLSLIRSLAYSTQANLLAMIRWCERFAGDARVSNISNLLRDAVRVLQTYAEPTRSHALHTFHSAYVTMPHCSLLDELAQAKMPEVRHTLVGPRAAHWDSSGPVLQAGSQVMAVAFAPDRPLVVAGASNGTLTVWSMDDFAEVAQLSGHKNQVLSLAISSDGSRIVSGSWDRTMRVWDGQTFEELGLCEHEDEVNSVTFSPDSTLIASGSDDYTVCIWNALSLEKVIRLAGHDGIVTSVAFFPDRARIASASLDCTVRMWDAHTYEPLPGLQCSGGVLAIAISPDSTRLALGEHTSGTDGFIHLFDSITLEEQAHVNISPGAFLPWAIAFSPGGDLIASGTASGAIQVWDANNLSNIATITGHHGQVTSIAFCSDGSQIISGSVDGTVRMLPVASSDEQLAPIPGHDARVTQLVFSSDGSRLVSGSDDNTVRIWDGLTCEELAVLHGHEDIVPTVAYSPDGARVISGSRDCTVRVWDALDFLEIAVLKGHRSGVTFVAFAPDGALIASCSYDRTVRLWSSSTFQESARLYDHRDTVRSVAFSPNGTRLVSMSEDKTIRVWDAVNFTQVAELEAHHQGIEYLFATFSLDGKAIMTRLQNYGPSWVCCDEDDTIWTAVSYHTAISAHPHHSQPISYDSGWEEFTTDSGLSRIWLPAERRSSGLKAVAASHSRLVIGGGSGAMTMIAWY